MLRKIFTPKNKFFSIILILLSLTILLSQCVNPETQKSQQNNESFQWEVARPESQGMSSVRLNAMKDTLERKGTKTLLIIRNDKIVYEWYASGFGPKKMHYTASLAKALVGGMSLLFALNDSLIYADAPACAYIPQWKSHPLKSKITIRQLATHSSGIQDANMVVDGRKVPHNQLPGWMGDFWRKDPDPFTISRDLAPVIFVPGTQYAYSNPGMAMLAYAVTVSLNQTKYRDIRTFLKERLMKPLGIKDDEWSIGYGKTYEVDNLKLVANWGGGSFTPRAVARLGRFMLRKGNWEGKQLVDSLWIKRVLQYAGTPLPERSKGNPVPASGLCWYVNFDGIWPQVPRDAFAGAGAGNQVLLVVPSLNLIVVRNGSDLFDPSQNETFWSGLEKYVFNPVMEAITDPPYPPSEFITKTEFAPKSSIIRRAKGSDNWPITWADDDYLYTAYGDGWGFEPKVDIKLSLGFARISGMPPYFEGKNIRSLSGERVGQGKNGPKASGMLMVDGVLYMLVRNVGNSQLAWSFDHGKTWIWADWKFETSFGCPTFLNFGKNYQGARDDYVYIYSPDEDSAYKPADRMVLARVHKNLLKNRDAYEFFSHIDKNGEPIWTNDIRKRGGVFFNPAKCYRSGISYNPKLRRYLWCQIIPGEDTRYKGGFGIYEAPEPWGAWKTVFYTREWDVSPGESACFPAKWISPDGKTCYLLFSGEDAFSVREVRFTVSQN